MCRELFAWLLLSVLLPYAYPHSYTYSKFITITYAYPHSYSTTR